MQLTSHLRLIAISAACALNLVLGATAAAAEPGSLVDPNLVFVEDNDLPRGFERLPQSDQLMANNGVITSIRNYENGDEEIQQIVYSTPSADVAKDYGGRYISQLIDEQHGEFREITTLGDRAATGYGVDTTGLTYHAVVFQLDTLACVVLWMTKEDVDREAETVALATKMEARAQAAVGQ